MVRNTRSHSDTPRPPEELQGPLPGANNPPVIQHNHQQQSTPSPQTYQDQVNPEMPKVMKPRQEPKSGPTRSASISAVSNQAEKQAGRTRISPVAVAAFEYVYAIEKKPNEALIRVLSQAFGETFLRVKVWFQNRRGRDTRDKAELAGVGRVGVAGLRRPSNLPPAVLRTLLNQQQKQQQQNPELGGAQQQQLPGLVPGMVGADLADSTAQALNAMLTVNSISKFWGHHNHLLSSELVLPSGDRVNVLQMDQNPLVKENPVVAALLERVLELRQGVIDQFIMTDTMIREVLPLESDPVHVPIVPPFNSNGRSKRGSKTQTSMTDGEAETGSSHSAGSLFHPSMEVFGKALPDIAGGAEISWETLGYTSLDPVEYYQSPFGDLNNTDGGTFNYNYEDHHANWDEYGDAGGSGRNLKAPKRTHSPSLPMIHQQHHTNNPSPMDMFLEDVDPGKIPIKTWILEALLKACKQVSQPAADLKEASTTAQFSPSDFHRLCSFISLHEEQRVAEGDLLGAGGGGGPIKVRVTPTLSGFAGWMISGSDFIRVLPEPIDEIFATFRFKDDSSSASMEPVEFVHFYLIFDLAKHILTIKAIFKVHKHQQEQAQE